MPARPDSCSAQTIQHAKKTSAMASVRFRSALAPRKQRLVDVKPSAVWCPQPIVPTPGNQTDQLATRMKMKIVAKNQNVRLTRCGPMMPSRKS